MEEQLLRCDTADDSKISSIEDDVKDLCLDSGAEEEWDHNDFTESQMEALNKLKKLRGKGKYYKYSYYQNGACI